MARVDMHKLEHDLERWQLTEAACLARVRELETAEQYILVDPKVEAVIRAEADVLSLLDGFEELRAELDRRLSVLTWLQSGRLVRDEDSKPLKTRLHRVISSRATRRGRCLAQGC